jgi:hypothetical protein
MTSSIAAGVSKKSQGVLSGTRGAAALALGGVSGAFIAARGGTALSQLEQMSGASASIGLSAGTAASKAGASIASSIGTGVASSAASMGIGAAVIGGILLARKLYQSPAEKLGKDIGRDIGVQVSPELLKAWEKDAKQFGRQATEILHLNDLISAAGGLSTNNLGMFVGKLRDVFSMIETGKLSVAQATQVLDANFAEMAQAGTDAFGFLSPKLREIIQLDQRFGTQSKAVADYLKAQGSAAIAASNDAIGALDKQIQGWDALKQKIDAARQKQATDAQSGASASTLASDAATLLDLTRQQTDAAAGAKGELEDLGVVAVATFGAAIAAGATFAEALAQAAPGLNTLTKAFNDLGISSDNAAFNALSLQASLLQNTPALIKGVSGLGNAFAALSNMGLLNVDTFSAMERSGASMYARIQGEVAALGGSTKDALLPMQDYLHKAQEAAEQLGIPLDDNTQMLIDQSKESGIWKDRVKSNTEILTDAVQTLVDKMNEFIDTLSGVPPRIGTTVDVTTNYRTTGTPPDIHNDLPTSGGIDPVPGASTGGLVTGRGIQRFRRGGMVDGFTADFQPLGTDIVPAMLTPGEIVLTADQQRVVGMLMQGSGAIGSGHDAAVLAELQALRATVMQQTSALAQSRAVSVQIDGREIVKASTRALDVGGALRTEHREVLGVA